MKTTQEIWTEKTINVQERKKKWRTIYIIIQLFADEKIQLQKFVQSPLVYKENWFLLELIMILGPIGL